MLDLYANMKEEENGSDYNRGNTVCPNCGVGISQFKKRELIDILLDDLVIFGIEC